jgi:hypothetical protein
MSESVQIVIDADDLASAKVAAAAKNVENNIKAIKTSGEQAKKSTEFFGVIANSLGGTELGAYASQLAGITEKTSQFAEVQKLGGAGALAFKAGLVGVVGVLGFQVGQALGNAIFETDRFNKLLVEGALRSKQLSAALLDVQLQRFKDASEDASFLDDDAQLKALKANRDEIKKAMLEAQGLKNALSQAVENVEKVRASTSPQSDMLGLGKMAFDSLTKNESEKLKADLADAETKRKALTDEFNAISRLTDERAANNKKIAEATALKKQEQSATEALTAEINLLEGKGTYISENVRLLTQERDLLKETKANEAKSESYLETLRNEVALLKAKGDELFKIEAGQKTFGAADNAEAASLLKERDILKQNQDAEKQAEQEAQRIADLKQKELDKLAEEQVLLTRGKEAAHAFALEKQGLSKADAANIAAQQAQNDQLKAKQTAKAPTQQINQAFEARLLTRGPTQGDPQAVIAQNTAAMLAEQKLANKLAEKNQQSTRIKVLKAGV